MITEKARPDVTPHSVLARHIPCVTRLPRTGDGRIQSGPWIPASAPDPDPGSAGMTNSRQTAGDEPPVDSTTSFLRRLPGLLDCDPHALLIAGAAA